jgi:uncharacterized protein
MGIYVADDVLDQALTELDQKLGRMREILTGLERVVVAFSGGVDSTLVLKAAVDCLGADHVIAATSHSDSLADSEFAESVALAERIGAEHVIVRTEEFSDPNYLSNPVNRCYFCKTALYEKLSALAKERGFKGIVNGTNADDLGDFRPGLKAADEFAVRAPAAEAGLTKAEIRELSKRFGLPTHDKPAAPCLSSRVQYGESITREKLARIERCEGYLRGLGVRECRVRSHDQLARIEVPASEIARLAAPEVRDGIERRFREAGFLYVTLDLKGFRSGSMNDVVSLGVAGSLGVVGG